MAGREEDVMRDKHAGWMGCAAVAGVMLAVAGFPGAASAARARPAAPAGTQVPGRLYSVAATGADNAWAVGLYPTGGLIMHWYNGSWVTSRQINHEYFMGVAAGSSNDVWAVGGNSWFAGSQTVAEHWNGVTWTRVPTPNPAGGGYFTSVAVVAPDDAWAVGLAGPGPGVTGPTTPLIEHWNGSTWTMEQFPVPATGGQFQGVAAASASSVWAVGSTGPVGQGNSHQTLIEHWNGTAWTQQPSPNPAGTYNLLYGVTATRTGNAWAVGHTYHYRTGTDQTLTLHWSQGHWTAVSSPNPAGDSSLSAVAADSAGEVWAVGISRPDSCSPRCGTEALHWTGRSWTTVSSPNPSSAYLNAYMGVAIIDGHDAWATGTTDEATTIIAHWDGKTWS
jgi:hypothetical protein